MSSEFQDSYSNDYGNHQDHSAINAQTCRDRIKVGTERYALLKEIRLDAKVRLAAQAIDDAKRDREIEEMKERFVKELLAAENAIGDAVLSVRTRDRQIINVNDQLCKSFMSIQRLHKSKHQVEADARREVRQEMRAEQEQMQATLDIQNKAAGRRYNNRSVATSKDMGRRTPSSGSFFSRASTGGGSGAGAANGENAGKAGK